MSFWFFKKRSDDDIKELHEKLDNSFSNVRDDMEKITSWIHHFHSKHQDHDKNFNSVIRRLDKVEDALLSIQQSLSEVQESKVEVNYKDAEKKESSGLGEESEEDPIWLELTETQQKLCWKIAALQKEMPNEWISLKYLAQDMYPDKEYATVRSTISQFIAQLEELGFVRRKRKGRQAYVCSTSKNPCDKKVKIAVKAKAAKKK